MKEKIIAIISIKLVGTELYIIGKDKLGHKITRVFVLE
jgi:hypothetical protein